LVLDKVTEEFCRWTSILLLIFLVERVGLLGLSTTLAAAKVLAVFGNFILTFLSKHGTNIKIWIGYAKWDVRLSRGCMLCLVTCTEENVVQLEQFVFSIMGQGVTQ
jgi:hypothetical protein